MIESTKADKAFIAIELGLSANREVWMHKDELQVQHQHTRGVDKEEEMVGGETLELSTHCRSKQPYNNLVSPFAYTNTIFLSFILSATNRSSKLSAMDKA